MKDELEALVPTHAAQPLPVYKDDMYVPPTEVNRVLHNALVKIHFTLKHYCIRQKGEKGKIIDSFSGLIEQIVVLKAGKARNASNYKRKNILEGPYRPKLFLDPTSLSSASSAPFLLARSSPTTNTIPVNAVSRPLISAKTCASNSVVPSLASDPKFGVRPISSVSVIRPPLNNDDPSPKVGTCSKRNTKVLSAKQAGKQKESN
jgi:hypothetical protein